MRMKIQFYKDVTCVLFVVRWDVSCKKDEDIS
jgi:hypothetical protein